MTEEAKIPLGFNTSATSLTAEIDEIFKALGNIDKGWDEMSDATDSLSKTLSDQLDAIDSNKDPENFRWLWTASQIVALMRLGLAIGGQLSMVASELTEVKKTVEELKLRQ